MNTITDSKEYMDLCKEAKFTHDYLCRIKEGIAHINSNEDPCLYHLHQMRRATELKLVNCRKQLDIMRKGRKAL